MSLRRTYSVGLLAGQVKRLVKIRNKRKNGQRKLARRRLFEHLETRDLMALEIISVSPSNGETEVPFNTDLVFTFNDNVNKGQGNVYLLDNSTGRMGFSIDVRSPTVTVNGAQVTVDLPSDLESNKTYYVAIDEGSFIDTSGTPTDDATLLTQTFDFLPLSPQVFETVGDGVDWTPTPPEGFVSTLNNPEMAGKGIDEWRGWTFARKEFWVNSEDQNRDAFVLGSGTIAVGDTDEYDDGNGAVRPFQSTLTTKPVDLTGVAANSIKLEFDSSFRPENSQIGRLSVSYDGGMTFTQLLELNPTNTDNDALSSKQNLNERLVTGGTTGGGTAIGEVDNPSSGSLVFSFYVEGGNDWWWALDNLKITGDTLGVPYAGLSDPLSWNFSTPQPWGVVGSAPTIGSVVTLPFTTLDLNFNEAYDFASASASDFAVDQGSVTSVSQVDADTLRLTLSGITVEGTLTVSMAAGAMTDVFGNPGAAFDGSYILDFGTVAYPTPFQAVGPSGSLVYEGSSKAGIIGFATDTDNFTIRVDRGQTITVLVRSEDSLQSSIALKDNRGAIVASALAAAPGTNAYIQTYRVPGELAGSAAPLDYTITIGGVAGSTGNYSVQVILNAALENENQTGAGNDSMGSAQNLANSFISINTGGKSTQHPARAAVIGSVGQLLVGSNQNAQFLQIDAATGAATLIASGVNNGRGYTDLARNPVTGILYGSGARNDNGLYVVDPTTGAGTLVGNPGSGMHALTWSPDGSTLYGVLRGALGTIDAANGTFTSIAYLGDYTHGMAFQPGTGALFAIIGRFSPSLYTINPADGTTNFVSVLSHSYQSLEFQADGTLLAGGDGSLYRINPMNGAETYVGFTGGGELIGLEAISADALDTYSFTLNAGQSANIVATGAGSGLELLDSGGTRLAIGVVADSGGQSINHFVAGSSGVYYVRVTRAVRGDYNLVVTRNVLFDTENNIDIASAQAIVGPEVAGRRWVMGSISRSDTYVASAQSYSFEDISGTGHAILQGSDDGSEFLSAAVLAGFKFTLDGAISDSVIVSANGYLVLPGGSSADVNVNRRDLVIFGAVDAAVYWQVLGTGDNQRLVVQWNNVGFYGQDGADPITFQVVLKEADNSLQFNYLDLETDLSNFNEGLNSTVGISYSSGSLNLPTVDAPNQFVGTGRSTKILQPPTKDFYKITANDGSTIELETSLPAVQSGEFVNNFDPMISLYDAMGNLIASNDNGGSGNRNAKLKYKVPKNGGGIFYIEVQGSNITAEPSLGEYFLSVKAANGALPTFNVSMSDPADGERLRGPISELTIDFNDIALLTTLQASDIQIDGVGVSNIEVIDGNTIMVTIGQVLSEGNHTVSIAAGALRDIQNTPIQAFSSSFYNDITAPRVIFSSIQEGQTIAGGLTDLTVTVGFSEAMDPSNIDAYDFSLISQFSPIYYVPSVVQFNGDGTELALTFSGVANEDQYTLTLWSGDYALQDQLGWDLDGEALAWPIPNNVSGDGIEGGNFVVSFAVDAATRVVPVPLVAVNPRGSLIYETTSAASGGIASVGDTDDWTIHVDPGQTISMLLDPSYSLAGSIEVIAPDNSTTVGSAIGSGTDQIVLLQTAPAVVGGVYTIRIGGDSGTIGQYSFEIIVNAALEEETYGGPSNDDTGSAQSIETSFIGLPGGATRGAVIGQTPLPSAITGEIEPNNDAFQAQNIDSGPWNLLDNPYIFDSTFLPHLSIQGTGDGTYDYYAFTVSTFDALGIFDLDFTENLDSWLDILDSSGNILATSDDAGNDPGSSTSLDSLIFYTFSNPGTYYVRVARYPGEPVPGGATYTLHVSLQDHPLGTVDRGSDIYSLTLADNQLASIAATSLTGGDVNINLLDGGGNVIASGIDVGTNVTEFIAFVGGRAGTYYVQVTGDSAVDYSLVVTRDAVLEIEDNDSPSTAQLLDLSSGSSIVLGNVDADQIMFHAFDSGWYLDSGFHGPANQNYFTGYAPNFGVARGFWAFDLAGLSGSSAIVGAHLELFSGLTSDTDFSETIAFYDVTTPVDELVAGGDGLVDIYADLGSGSFFGSREVLFNEDFTVLQFGLNVDAITAVLAAAGNQFAIGSALTTIDVNSLQQNLFGSSGNPANLKRLVLDIAEQDYYEVTLAAGQTLNLETSTPGGGSGEFVNNVDPLVRVYDADGNVVAQDDNSADGRNAMLAFLSESAGTYWIEVSSSGGIGEYTLSLTTIDGPAPTLQNNFFLSSSGPSYSAYSDANWFDGHLLVGDSVAASFEAGSLGFKLRDQKPVNARWSAPFAWMPGPDQSQQSDWLVEGRLTGSQTPFDKCHRAEHLDEELVDQVFGKNLDNGWEEWL